MTEQEFKETVLPHQAMMLAEAMRLLKNRNEALDCLQDAVTVLWKSRQELTKVSNIKAYCIKSVSNRALEIIRQRRISYSEDSDDLPGDVTPASTIEIFDRLPVNTYVKDLLATKTLSTILQGEELNEQSWKIHELIYDNPLIISADNYFLYILSKNKDKVYGGNSFANQLQQTKDQIEAIL